MFSLLLFMLDKLWGESDRLVLVWGKVKGRQESMESCWKVASSGSISGMILYCSPDNALGSDTIRLILSLRLMELFVL